jgi:hypothetical protein
MEDRLNDILGDISLEMNPLKSERTEIEEPKRTFSYYQKMKETKPKLYLDPKISRQMEKDSQTLGASFFDD